jgi:predicted Zn-dependent peptidase
MGLRGRLRRPVVSASSARPLPFRTVPTITTSTLPNGMPLHRIAVEGTRAVTILVAFDAGARTERPEENGMAHFLEHLVFKGGEKYPTYRDVNNAAERIGAVLNAYTSHDLVAFHITVRAQRALEAADLLTDFVGRPRIDPEELDRERGVVVQEIARANDQPSTVAEHLIDEAVFGDHPLGRPVLGTPEHIRDTFTRDGILSFRSRRWSPGRAAAFAVGNLDSLPENGQLDELFSRFEAQAEPQPYEPAPAFEPRVLVGERDSNQSHLRMSYRPGIDVSSPKQRAALVIYSTLLGGSMGSRLFDEIREQRGLAYSVNSIPHAYADVPVLQLSAGLESSKCIEAYQRMREIVTELREQGPTEAEVERARAYAAGARAIAFENTGAVARHAAQQTIVYREEVDPDRTIALIDEVTTQEVTDIAGRIADELSVAVVGPHTAEEMEAA